MQAICWRSGPQAAIIKSAMKQPTPININEQTLPAVHELIRSVGGDPDTFQGRLITQLIQTSLKLIPDGHDTGQLKLITSAMKEMRYAYRVFNRYRGVPKITIDRKSTRLNSSHVKISYAVFCLKKKK